MGTHDYGFIKRYYTGYPKDLGPSKVVHFTSECQCAYTRYLDRVLEEAAAEFYPHVECPKYPGFCLTRQKKEYPFIEIFHSPEQAANEGRIVDSNITKYSVKVLPYNYDLSAYGFREFFKKHGMHASYLK
ncbi:hypothetical protein Taro_046196 [Colocasia esculenta]|uniref:Uncharacterized protein n=1 Tax=Colocasia esculenta TaxID=4460 RepID=A0A843X3U0_COLES|nr:hypothetical protein [Colocasia esculenta]